MTTTTGTIAAAGQAQTLNINTGAATYWTQFNNLSTDILIIAYNGLPASPTNGLIVPANGNLQWPVGATSGLAYPGYLSVWGPTRSAAFSVVVN